MSKRKVFIVEDDPLFAEMLKDYLKSRPQWEVSYFPTGEECVQVAYQDPDVVIIDYHLDNLQAGGMNGIDTMVQLKKIAPGAHCVFLSGQKRYGVALQTISHGAENYIFKDENAFVEIGKILDTLPVD
ncbi:MAG TPA: response regulator transcription factor [Bacteroidia bacterium]|nr:response regulator transcription factor [Bacteroidia bacterium]